MTQVADTETRRKPRRTWAWILLALFAVFALTLVIGGLSIRAVGEKKWKAMQQRQAVLLAQLTSGTGEREPLAGPALEEGNAWDEYLAVLSAIGKMSDEESTAQANMMWSSHSSPMTPERIARREAGAVVMAKVLERIRPELDRLRAAGRRSCAKKETPWQHGMAMEMGHLAQIRMLCRVLACSIRMRVAAGNLDGALDDLETSWQLAVDTANAPGLISTLVGIACAHIVSEDIPELLRAAAPEQRARLARLAKGVDAQFPTLASTMDAERALMNETMKTAVEDGGGLEALGTEAPIAIAWRQGFSLKIVAAECDLAYQRGAEEARKAESMPWLQANALLLESAERADNSGNPLLKLLFVSNAGPEKSLRTLHARLRLIQAAVLKLDGAGETDPDWPDDPFSLAPIKVRVDPTGTVFWSRLAGGPDTATGWWVSTQDADDLVLEVKSK